MTRVDDTSPSRRSRRSQLAAAAAAGTAALIAALAFAVLAPARPTPAVADVPTASAPASLYVTILSGPVAAGDPVTVEVRLRSDSAAVNAVQADLAYSPAQLAYVSADTNAQTWGITAYSGGGAGAVSVQVGATAPVSGDTRVVTVAFRALTAGAPQVTVAPTSLALSAADQTNLLVAPPADGEPTPAATPEPQPSTSAHGGGGHGANAKPVGVQVRAVRWRGRTLRVRLRCPAQAPSRCRVAASLRDRRGKRVGTAAAIAIPAGHQRTATLRLGPSAFRRVRRSRAAFRLRLRTVTSAGVVVRSHSSKPTRRT